MFKCIRGVFCLIVHVEIRKTQQKQEMAGVYHFLVYAQTARICSKRHKARPIGARRAPVVRFAAYINSLHIYQEMLYTSPFHTKPKPGGGVYMW